MTILTMNRHNILSGVVDFYIKRVVRYGIYTVQDGIPYLIATYESYKDVCREMENIFNALKNGEEYYCVG